jgi:hypothetical protein
MTLKISKAEDGEVEQRMVWGEVYAPGRPDAHNEFMTAETIRKMAHEFVSSGKLKSIDREHNNELIPGVQIVESFIARKADPDFIEGSWVVGLYVGDDNTWAAIKKGEINGFSVEAMVIKEIQDHVVDFPPVISGATSVHKGEDAVEHTHTFYVTYDAEGNFRGGVTDQQNGHSHVIKRGTATEVVNGHSHRFSSVDGVEIVS